MHFYTTPIFIRKLSSDRFSVMPIHRGNFILFRAAFLRFFPVPFFHYRVLPLSHCINQPKTRMRTKKKKNTDFEMRRAAKRTFATV